MANLDNICFQSAVRGYHIYNIYWTPELGEVLSAESEPGNPYDRFSVAVKLGLVTVGHLPCEQSRICHYFIKRGGTINVEITNPKRRRSNLQQGGLEIPSIIHCIGSKSDITKLSNLVKDI